MTRCDVVWLQEHFESKEDCCYCYCLFPTILIPHQQTRSPTTITTDVDGPVIRTTSSCSFLLSIVFTVLWGVSRRGCGSKNDNSKQKTTTKDKT